MRHVSYILILATACFITFYARRQPVLYFTLIDNVFVLESADVHAHALHSDSLLVCMQRKTVK